MNNLRLTKSIFVVVANGLAACLLLISGNSHAEYFVLMSGRSADIANLTDKFVEAGFVTGDIVMPTSFGKFYAVADMIDELTLGFGVRYFLQ